MEKLKRILELNVTLHTLVGSEEFLERPKTWQKLLDEAVNNENLMSNPELALTH